jgi:arabinofuranosyltransferase
MKNPRYKEWLLVAGLVALALLARLVPGERTVDDAYITFRYARNVARGVGFVYNAGQRVLGTTTPLYTLLMAALSLTTGSGDFPALALAVNALAGAFSVGMLYALGKRFARHPAPATAAALLWALAPFSVSFAIGGLETDLTIGLLIAAAHAYLVERPRALAILSALALLARPDTAILLGPLWLGLVLAQRRIPWREGLIAMAILAPWVVFGTLYFGSPLTNSIAAKSVVYLLPPGSAFLRLLQHYATPFFERNVLPPYGVFVALVVYCGLCALGAINAFRRDRKTWPLIVYPLAYFAVFALANPLIFRWYLSPPLPFYFLLIITGVWTVSGDIGRLVVGKLVDRETSHLPIYQFTSLPFTLFTVAALALTLNAWTLHPDHGPDRPAPEMAWFGGEIVYRQIALDLKERLEPGDVVAIADIGTFGYYSEARILDPVGLVSPGSSRYYPIPPEQHANALAIPTPLILDQRPEYVILLEVYIRHTLLESDLFDAQYELYDIVETDILGSAAFMVFRRSDLDTDEKDQ